MREAPDKNLHDSAQWLGKVVRKLIRSEISPGSPIIVDDARIQLSHVVKTERIDVIRISLFRYGKRCFYYAKLWKDAPPTTWHRWDDYEAEHEGLSHSQKVFAPHAPRLSGVCLAASFPEYKCLVTEEAEGISLKQLLLWHALSPLPRSLGGTLKRSLMNLADWIYVFQSGRSCGKKRYDIPVLRSQFKKEIWQCVEHGNFDIPLAGKLLDRFEGFAKLADGAEFMQTTAHNALEMQNIIVRNGNLSVLDFGRFSHTGDQYGDISRVWVELGLYGMYGLGGIQKAYYLQESFLHSMRAKVELNEQILAFQNFRLLVHDIFGASLGKAYARRYRMRLARHYQISCLKQVLLHHCRQ